MARSSATTVGAYLDELDDGDRGVVDEVRAVDVRGDRPPGAPLRGVPDGPVVGPGRALEDFRAAYVASGRKLDMGTSCVRFRTLDDLPLDVVGDEIARLSVDEFVEIAERAHA